MLTDTYGRKFSYLRLSITDVCNFSCNYCLPDGYQCNSDRNFLTTTEISRIIATFAELGTKKIRITGGEPSLRKDLPEIISIAKQTQGIETVALTTNAYKLYDHIESWIDAGLNALNISIDSLDPRLFNTITGHNKLPYILKGIDKAFALGLKNIKMMAADTFYVVIGILLIKMKILKIGVEIKRTLAFYLKSALGLIRYLMKLSGLMPFVS